MAKLEFSPEPSRAERNRAAGKAPKKRKPTVRDRIPRLPASTVDVTKLQKPNQRSVACVNMKLAGAPWHAIAEELGYATPKDAEDAYVAALAGMYPVENWETLRQTEALRAEQQLARSVAMASAEYLELPDGTRVANTDRLRWHEQAGKDLALHATITGAKAPTRVEVSADTATLNSMVDLLVQGSGGDTIIDADVFDIGELEQLPEPDPMGS